MQLYLYKTKDSNRVLNKTLTNESLLNINLKRDTDIVRPTIQLMKVTGINFKQFNYAHIPELNRFYFINHIESVNNSVDKLYLECDVLETYKADILNCSGTIKRDIKAGDYGAVNADSTVNIITTHKADVKLTLENNIVLTTLEVRKNG